MRAIAFLACLTLGLMAGCGREPAPTVPARAEASPDVIGLPMPGEGTAAGAAGDAPGLLRAMGRAVAGLKTATYEGVMYVRGSHGTQPKALTSDHGEWEATTTYDVAYQAAASYRIDVASCTNPRSVGMRMHLKADQIDVKLPGVLGLVTMHLAYDDANVLDFRGNRADLDAFNNLARRFATSPPADARLAGAGTLDGQPLDMVELPRGPSFDRAVVKEVLGLDRVTHLVRYHAMFTGQRKVYEMQWRNLRPNVAIAPERFVL